MLTTPRLARAGLSRVVLADLLARARVGSSRTRPRVLSTRASAPSSSPGPWIWVAAGGTLAAAGLARKFSPPADPAKGAPEGLTTSAVPEPARDPAPAASPGALLGPAEQGLAGGDRAAPPVGAAPVKPEAVTAKPSEGAAAPEENKKGETGETGETRGRNRPAFGRSAAGSRPAKIKAPYVLVGSGTASFFALRGIREADPTAKVA